MSIYRKDEYGDVVRVAGNIVQRWNNRIFTTTHRVDDGKDYYDIDISANKFIIKLTPYTFFQLHLDALNISSEIYITFNGQTLRVKQSNGEPILPGTLNRIKLFYTFDLEVAEIWYDSPLELLSPEVKLLYENNPNTNVFTDAEKSKLAGLESSKFVGQFLSLSALQAAFPTAPIGSYAFVDGGPTIRVKKYLWDSDDFEWVLANSPLQELTPAQVKQLYEENDDTNAFTDDEKDKLTDLDLTIQSHISSTSNPHNVSKSQVGLDNVDNTSDLDKPISTLQQAGLDSKVDKVTGKGLSTNDYTTTEKNKLAGIASGAEVNVQSDWDATSGDALILNKPYIPTKVSDLTNDTGYITGYTETDPIFTAWNKSTGISITKSQVSDLIEATQALSGLMSATDKQRLDVLHSLLEEDTENSVVDSINEVLAIFNNYPEGADLVTALAGKVDKIEGKGLSTNDYTNTDKQSVEKIPTIEQDILDLESDKVDKNNLGYMNYAADIFYRGGRQSLFANAWEHSLTVDPTEIERISTTVTQYGTLQYPNGEDNGVIIPNSVTSIGNYAFYDWSSNNQPLVIPNSVTSIGAEAFYKWSSNNQPLVIPNSVTSIGSSSFRDWASNNQPLVIPNSVTSIGSSSFRDWASNNQPLVIPNSVTSIGAEAFHNWTSNNQPLVIPDSVTSIGNFAFTNWTSNNQPLVIPDSVTSIGNFAFNNWASNNQPLVIPDSVTSIGDGAFYNWTANNHPLVIPDSVTSIGFAAFVSWSLVPYVEIQAITPPTLGNAYAFDGQNNAPIYVPDESVDAYKTATNWVSLADRIFPINDNPTNLNNLDTWNTATKTLALGDSNKLFRCSYASDQTLTIPTNADVAFPIGTMITFLLTSTNAVTFSGASGVTLTSIDSLVELATQFAMASLIKTDTNTWQIVGATITKVTSQLAEKVKFTDMPTDEALTLIAHRGLMSYAPENTLPAFTVAQKNGLKQWEMDVHVSSDGIPFLLHDATLDRTTNGAGSALGKTYAELVALDAGTKFSPFFAGTRIPTLQEVLDLAQGRAEYLYIEIKSVRNGEDIKMIAQMIKDAGWERKSCIQVANLSYLSTIRIVSDVNYGALFFTEPTEVDLLTMEKDGKCSALMSYSVVLNKPSLVKTCRERGIGVGVFTVDDRATINRLVKLGVSKIMTNKLVGGDVF